MKKGSKLAARFNFINIILIVFILVLTIVVCGAMIYTLADRAAIGYARTYTMESVDILGSYLNKEISLIRQAAQSSVIREWFADENNPEKKEQAFQKMILFADMLEINGLHFVITDSLNEYSIDADAPFQNFKPTRTLASVNGYDNWFFEATGSMFDFTMDLAVRPGTDSFNLWINHKVMQDGRVVGIFSSALDFDEIFQDLFGLYEGQNVRGLVIDYRGIVQIDSALSKEELISGGPSSHILSVNTETNFVSVINNNYLRNPAIFYGRRTEPEVIRLTGGGYRYLSIAPIPFTNWLAITFYDTGALFDITTFLPPVSAVVLAFIIYLIISQVIIRRMVFKPLGLFTQSVAISDYETDKIYGLSRDDEIGELARTAKESWDNLRELTIELKIAADEAESANVSKSAFLAKMSHEIRTPMNVILGITEILMQNNKFDATTNEELATIYNSCDMLLSIINDILDLSKIEAGKLEVFPAKYELASLIHDSAVLNIMRTGSKPIEFKLTVDEKLPAILIGDELRIKQILSNILSNAFKYTDRGRVDLSFYGEEAESDDVMILVFSVRDTGHGLTKDEISKMFDEYSRFNLGLKRRIEGTGLGMNITQNLLRMMNGTITVESEPNKGSTFFVRIPQGKINDAVLGPELVNKLQEFRLDGIKHIKKANITYEPMPYGKILIVDDVESNLFVAKGLMIPYELVIETVTSGFLAIDKIKSGNTYDIIFMDHMMPKMDGIQATGYIRNEGYTGTIIALTANAVVGQADMFLLNGFDDFISKPIDIRRLNTLLRKYIRDIQPQEVLDAAKHHIGQLANLPDNDISPDNVSRQLAEFFVLDAKKVVSVMENTLNQKEPLTDEDIVLYTTSVHAMKSILNILGEPELSSFAASLERAGQSKDIPAIKEQTAEFSSGLQKVIEKFDIKNHDDHENVPKNINENYDKLKEKLTVIKIAFEMYDRKTAKEELAELRKETWLPKINELLGTMAEQLLSGDIDGLSASVESIEKESDR